MNCLKVVLFADMFIEWRRFLGTGAPLHHVSSDAVLYFRDINCRETFAGMLGAEIDEVWVTHNPTLIRFKRDLKLPFDQESTKLLNTHPIV